MVFRVQTDRRRSLDFGRELRHCMWSIGKNASSLRNVVKNCDEVRRMDGSCLPCLKAAKSSGNPATNQTAPSERSGDDRMDRDG
jgi:hypothetical protein